jgi:hypothetical protein
MVEGGRSGGPTIGFAGVKGATLVTTLGAGNMAGLGGATGTPGSAPTAVWLGVIWNKALAMRAITDGSGKPECTPGAVSGASPGESSDAVRPNGIFMILRANFKWKGGAAQGCAAATVSPAYFFAFLA